MTEADEIAANLPLDGVTDWASARLVVAQRCGPPEDFGYVQTDNVVAALVRRALYTPEKGSDSHD